MAQATKKKSSTTVGMGRKLVYGAIIVVVGYLLLVVVFPRVLDGYQYHSFNTRLGSIERSVAILLDRLGGAPGGADGQVPREANFHSTGDIGERELVLRLEEVTLALEKLRIALEAQTRALETIAPLIEPLGPEGGGEQR
ncbi:MAG: hypothetical protein GY711_05000 [bacterium]|nr:hypothetical protein [bacterium]